MADLAGWPYWKVISITGQAGSGTDYQVKLEIGDSAGGDFHLEGHCTNFPQDIRITDDDGTTLLDHWVEDIAADPIVVHVEVKDDLGSNQDIRVYYGKSGETSASNGANTFIQWHGIESSSFHDTNVLPVINIVYEARVKPTSGTHIVVWGISELLDDSQENLIFRSKTADNLLYAHSTNDGSSTLISEAPSLAVDTYYRLKMVQDSSSAHFYRDDNEVSTGINTYLPDEALGLKMRVAIGTAAQDWSFVRKYNSPEPAFSSAGTEQTPDLVSVFIRHNPALTGGMV